jgi:uncharacterized membrane protein
MDWLVGIIVIAIVIGLMSNFFEKKKRQRLMDKYGSEYIVDKIMKKMIWQGQTEDQLIDSIGNPRDVDQKVLKTKVKETWKYEKTGENRYNLRVIIENGAVVGWNKK